VWVLGLTLLTGWVFVMGYFTGQYIANREFKDKLAQLNVEGESQEKMYPLLKYSFSELANRGGIASELKIERELEKTADFTAYVFTYKTDEKKISGQINIPKNDNSKPLPVILMMRGYVPLEEYQIGSGTKNTAAVLSRAGYITIAPDFLGYGESDSPPGPIFAERFVKPMNVMDLYATVQNLDGKQITFQKKNLATVDAFRLGLWGHSNGGQISLSFLEITGNPIPTVLWAPVTKPFPFSVLFFSDEVEDNGKGLRGTLAKFEEDYDIENFTIGNRLDMVRSKIQLHQGSEDDAVPQKWSDEFYSHFAGKGKKDQIEYYVYPGGNHGLYPDIQTVLDRTLAFYEREVKNRQPEPTATPIPTSTPTPLPTLEPIQSTQSATPATVSATPQLIP
jgi:dienelactone hydrolase